MSSPDGSSTLTLNDPQTEEDRMRAAFGLAPERTQPGRPIQHGHRPGRDSKIPVTVVSTRRPSDASDDLRARLATLEDTLKVERGERIAAQQALAEAQRTIQQLQTKLAHTEMAAAEALDAEHTARRGAEAKLLDMTSAAAPKPALEEPAEARKRGRPPRKQPVVIEQSEPEPVQWWLPSYAASIAKRSRSRA